MVPRRRRRRCRTGLTVAGLKSNCRLPLLLHSCGPKHQQNERAPKYDEKTKFTKIVFWGLPWIWLGSNDPMIPSMSGDPIHAQSLASFFKFILRIFEK
jgi:hypothetical protein